MHSLRNKLSKSLSSSVCLVRIVLLWIVIWMQISYLQVIAIDVVSCGSSEYSCEPLKPPPLVLVLASRSLSTKCMVDVGFPLSTHTPAYAVEDAIVDHLHEKQTSLGIHRILSCGVIFLLVQLCSPILLFVRVCRVGDVNALEPNVVDEVRNQEIRSSSARL